MSALEINAAVSQSASSKWRSKFSVITVEPVMFLSQLISFTQFGVMQDLIYKKVCLHSIYNQSCSDLGNESLTYVQKEGSHWIRYCNIAVFIPAIISAIYMGSWCCQYGAKLPMVLATLGSIFSNLVNVILSVYIHVDVAYLLIGQFISGLFGGSIGLTMAVMSYISLITSTDNRTVRIGALEAMLSLGATAGPFLGGYLLDKTNHAYVFLFLLCTNFFVMLYIILRIRNIIPHSSAENGEDAAEKSSLKSSRVITRHNAKRLFACDHFISTLATCFRKRDQGKRKFIILILLGMAVYMICAGGEADTAYLFTKDEPLKWEYSMYSYYYGMNQGLRTVALIFIMPLLKHFWDLRDPVLGLLGILSAASSLLFLSFSTTPTMIFCVPLFAIFTGFCVASMRSMLSKLTGKDEHGKMFAFVAVMENCSYLVASVTFNSLYPITRSFMHGFIFVLAAILDLVPICVLVYLNFAMRSFYAEPEFPETYSTFSD